MHYHKEIITVLQNHTVERFWHKKNWYNLDRWWCHVWTAYLQNPIAVSTIAAYWRKTTAEGNGTINKTQSYVLQNKHGKLWPKFALTPSSKNPGRTWKFKIEFSLRPSNVGCTWLLYSNKNLYKFQWYVLTLICFEHTIGCNTSTLITSLWTRWITGAHGAMFTKTITAVTRVTILINTCNNMWWLQCIISKGPKKSCNWNVIFNK